MHNNYAPKCIGIKLHSLFYELLVVIGEDIVRVEDYKQRLAALEIVALARGTLKKLAVESVRMIASYRIERIIEVVVAYSCGCGQRAHELGVEEKIMLLLCYGGLNLIARRDHKRYRASIPRQAFCRPNGLSAYPKRRARCNLFRCRC